MILRVAPHIQQLLSCAFYVRQHQEVQRRNLPTRPVAETTYFKYLSWLPLAEVPSEGCSQQPTSKLLSTGRRQFGEQKFKARECLVLWKHWEGQAVEPQEH